MKCRTSSGAKVVFGCFNILFFTCGFLEVVCGFLLLCDSKRILMSRLLASPESSLVNPPFYYLALALLASGLAMSATAALGCWATYIPGYIILTFYFLVVLCLLLCECAGGVLTAVWPRCLGLQSTPGGAVVALQTYYGVLDYEQFTASVDLVQTELQCCGVTDARNYDMSVWQLKRLGPRGISVPLSCCVQPEDSASYLNPRPVNASRCQEILPNPAFRYRPGCLEKLEEWYEKQYLVMIMSLFIFALLKLGILLSTVFSCIRHKRQRRVIHSITVQTVDNKSNEKYYANGTSREEPITAKYIQPNNFYSPRVRNPRIFSNKQNEIV